MNVETSLIGCCYLSVLRRKMMFACVHLLLCSSAVCVSASSTLVSGEISLEPHVTLLRF